MTKFVFGYIPESVGSRVIYRPKIPVFLCTVQKEWRGFQVYVDSGADLSLFTRSDAELLGLSFNQGEYRPIMGLEESLSLLTFMQSQ